jgi:Leucine Rich repeat
LHAFRNGLSLCTSITTVSLTNNRLKSEALQVLLPAFFNTAVTALNLAHNSITGQFGGSEVLRDLLAANKTLLTFNLSSNPIGSAGAAGLWQGLVFATGSRSTPAIQKLCLNICHIGNDGLATLPMMIHKESSSRLTDLHLCGNNINGSDGGHRLALLLQCFPSLRVLKLDNNNLGPLGAAALAPSLVLATRLERLDLSNCGLGNEGVANLIPAGHVNTSLTHLDLRENSNIQDGAFLDGENIIALAARCTNLDYILVDNRRSQRVLNPDQRLRLDMLLDRKRLVSAATALGGAPFSVLFRFVKEQAHGHEHGLGAIFMILQNDGDDHFCTANNRTEDMAH